MIKNSFYHLSVIIILGISNCLNAQTANEAAAYMNLIGEQYEDINKEMWDYVSTMVNGRSVRKVDKKRIVLLNTIDKSINEVKGMKALGNDCSLRDSVVNFLTLNFNVLNNDFGKILDMEEIAEQSYDLMEAYLLAQEKANEKLEIASERMDNQYKSFANKYNVTIIENTDKISQKLKKSSEALKYYNQVYLVFFKAYKQEFYLLDALERVDINSIEQNRNALSSISNEGIEKLANIGHFKGDNSINSSCKRLLMFYKDEAETKIPIVVDFLQTTNEYNQMVALFESKDRMLLTNEEVNRYNRAIDNYKKGINRFNSTNNTLNTRRANYIDMWNNSVSSFMSRHIPKK
jgi:hypothetical protein